MIFEHPETGLRVVVNAVESRIPVTFADGTSCEVSGRTSLVTDAGQPCIATGGERPIIEVIAYTDVGSARLVRVN